MDRRVRTIIAGLSAIVVALAVALFVFVWLRVLVIAEPAVAAETALAPSPDASVLPSIATLTSPDEACEASSRSCSLEFV